MGIYSVKVKALDITERLFKLYNAFPLPLSTTRLQKLTNKEVIKSIARRNYRIFL